MSSERSATDRATERGAWIVVGSALTALYPFVVWYGLTRWSPRALALALCVVVLVRVGATPRWWPLTLAGGLALAAAAAWSGAALPLKLYPVVVNATLFVAFAWSVIAPPTIIERFARLRAAELDDATRAYLRRLTMVWCGFFVVNGSIAAITARWASPAVWSLYNGLIAYLLIGALLGGELLVRRWVRRNASD
jgi:uncharacterized membrane protein